jgi:hypothetical protein
MRIKNSIGYVMQFIILFIIIAAAVNAYGIAPSRDLIPFDMKEHTFTVRIVNSEHKDFTMAIYLSGELKDYATLDTTLVKLTKDDQEKSITYTIKLPNTLEPGQRDLDVLFIELPQDYQSDTSNVKAGVATIYQLKIDVPYPGTYADGTLYVSNAKKGEPIIFTTVLYNKGQNDILADVDIIIKGPTNEEIRRFKLGQASIPKGSQGKIEGSITNDLNPGEYVAEAIIQYNGETAVLRKVFYSGDMFIDVKSVDTSTFKIGTVATFDVNIENKWNQPINDVYADVTVLDNKGNSVSTYKSGTVSISPLGTQSIRAYWDTKDNTIGNYDLKIILNYAGKTTEKIFKTVIGIDSIKVSDFTSGQVIASGTAGDSKYTLVLILLLVILVINIGWFVYFKFLKNKT